jgi:phosphate transport system substrate-binding protein
VYFLESVLRLGDSDSPAAFAPDTLLMPSSVGITSEVRRNPNAVGYDGLGYVSEDEERLLALARAPEGPYVRPTVATAADGSYPLARPLFVDTAGPPTGALAEYLDWITGPAGQAIVAELGFVPVTGR